jgi:hypothetical protein
VNHRSGHSKLSVLPQDGTSVTNIQTDGLGDRTHSWHGAFLIRRLRCPTTRHDGKKEVEVRKGVNGQFNDPM